MKKGISLLLSLVMIMLCIPFCVSAEQEAFEKLPSYNDGGWICSYAGSYIGKSFTIDKQLDSYIMKFKLSTTDELTGNTWINLKNGHTRLYFDGAALKAEKTWATYDFVTLKDNCMTNDGAVHDFLIWVNSANVYVYEKESEDYMLIGAYVSETNGVSSNISFSSQSWDMILSDIQIFEEVNEPDYVNDWELVNEVTHQTGEEINISGNYKNFIAEYKIKATSTGNETTSPYFWHMFRIGGTGNSLITDIVNIGDPSILKGVSIPDTYNYISFAGARPISNDEYHTYRVWFDEKNITVDEKVNGVWMRAGNFTYGGDKPVAGGAIRFARASGDYPTTFDLEYIRVYEPITLTAESEANGLEFVPLDYVVPIDFKREIADNLNKENLEVLVSGVETTDYTIIPSTDKKIAYLKFDGDLEGSSIYNITVKAPFVSEDMSFSFKTGYAAVSAVNADDSRDSWESSTHDYFVSDGTKLTVNNATGENFYGYIKGVNCSNAAVRWGQTVSLGTGGYNPIVFLRYNKKNVVGREDVDGTYSRLDLRNGDVFTWDGTVQNTDYSYNLEGFYNEGIRTDSYLAVNGDKMYLYAKNAGDKTYSFLGEKNVGQYTGTGYVAFDCRASKTVFEDLDISVSSIFAENIFDAPANRGEVIVIPFNSEVAICPESVLIGDVSCPARIGDNRKTIEITLGGNLEYSMTYSNISLNGVKDIYGAEAENIEITTCDEPIKYDISNMRYTKNGNNLEINFNLKRLIYEASDNVQVISIIYKKTDNNQLALIDMDVKHVDNLSKGIAKPISGTLSNPNDTDEYIIKTFIWDNLETCTPLCSAIVKNYGDIR